MIENTIPILNVASLDPSLEYYADALGFHMQWKSPSFAGVDRDGHGIYICDEGQGHPGTWVWVGVQDVDGLHREYVASCARILQPPTEYPWAREMRVEDLDGNVLRFGGAPSGEAQ